MPLVTTMVFETPAMKESTESVAVIVCGPGVSNVTLNVPTPSVKMLGGGRTAFHRWT